MDHSYATSAEIAPADREYTRLMSVLQNLPVQECILQIKQFLLTFPACAQANNDLGVLCQRTGDSTLALAYHEKACRLQPDNITFSKNLADFYAVELGWLDDAVTIYLDILRRNPRDIEALIAVGKLGSAMESSPILNRPLDCPDKVILPEAGTAAENPGLTAEALYAEASWYVAAGCHNEAHSLLEELVHQYPDHAVGYNDLGVLRHQLGDLQGAMKAYEQAILLQPHNITFRKNLADLYFVELGRTDEAITIYLELFREKPADEEILTSLGRICDAVGRPDEAKNFYERALAVNSHNEACRAAIE